MSADASIALLIHDEGHYILLPYNPNIAYHMNMMSANASFAFLIHGEEHYILLLDSHHRPYQYHNCRPAPGRAQQYRQMYMRVEPDVRWGLTEVCAAIGAWYKSSRSSSSGIGMRMFGGEFIEESCSSSKLSWLCSLLPESVVWILARLQWMTLPLD